MAKALEKRSGGEQMTGIIILIGSILSVIAVGYGSKVWGGKK
jgi:hypothetical protein